MEVDRKGTGCLPGTQGRHSNHPPLNTSGPRYQVQSRDGCIELRIRSRTLPETGKRPKTTPSSLLLKVNDPCREKLRHLRQGGTGSSPIITTLATLARGDEDPH